MEINQYNKGGLNNNIPGGNFDLIKYKRKVRLWWALILYGLVHVFFFGIQLIDSYLNRDQYDTWIYDFSLYELSSDNLLINLIFLLFVYLGTYVLFRKLNYDNKKTVIRRAVIILSIAVIAAIIVVYFFIRLMSIL